MDTIDRIKEACANLTKDIGYLQDTTNKTALEYMTNKYALGVNMVEKYHVAVYNTPDHRSVRMSVPPIRYKRALVTEMQEMLRVVTFSLSKFIPGEGKANETV